MKVLDIENIKKVASSIERSPSGNLKSTIIRARNIINILERDNYQCVECPNIEELTIDHTNGRKFAKHDNHMKYKLDKCRVLCNKCHTERNKNEKTFKLKTECPYCKYKLDAHFNSKDGDDKEGPKDGDYGFCIKCGEPFTFLKSKAIKIDMETIDEEFKVELRRITDAWLKMKAQESVKEVK